MTSKVTSFLTFGIFLIIIGAISKLMKWSQADLLIAIGLLFELLAALMFLWKKLKNN